MKIIDTIQIKYFRSIWKVRLDDLADVNVLSGRNDIGKSNVLKALNLFFNNELEWQEEIDFYRDFSKQRLRTVRQDTVKGKQFISVKIWFNRPRSYSGSLPEQFAVKRTWDRNSSSFNQRDYLDTAKKQGDLPTRLPTARQSLSQLLNKVQFEYVPAIRDRSYFSHLLERLQGILLTRGSSSDVEIAGTAEALARHVDDRISNLQEEFYEATGIHTELEPPTDIAALFRAFGVSTADQEGEHDGIPLNLRGDGIQGRYVPSVLNYIAEGSGKLFIWGFEEPENSLEYRRVGDLAKSLVTRYASNAQIFVTSHSPAFTSLDAENVNVFRVFEDDEGLTSTVLVEDVEGEPHGTKLREELGLLEIEKEAHDRFLDLRKKHDRQTEQLKALEAQLEQHRRPKVVVEGKWDRKTLMEAWSRLRDEECPFKIVEADPAGRDGSSTGGAGAVRLLLSSRHLGEHPVVGLFDRDKKGLKQLEKLPQHFHPVEDYDGVYKHASDTVYAAVLPTNEETERYGRQGNLPIEFLFPDEVLETTNEDGAGLELRLPQATLNFEGTRVEISQKEAQDQLGDEIRYLRKLGGNKTAFHRDVVPHLDDDHFRNFEPVFELLEELVSEEE